MLWEVFKNSKVLVTGHSGFKGSWLTQILESIGAEVYGISLPNEPKSLFKRFEIVRNDRFYHHDINDFESLSARLEEIQPEVVFHLAAQPLVLDSYSYPMQTFQTNVMGTANVLEACRLVANIRTIVIVTTDKVYKENALGYEYTEDSPLGGADPYSASKSAAEMVVNAWRSLTWGLPEKPTICTVRAGNVIGGGDQSQNRLLPDLIRSFKSNTQPILRNVGHVRPWQHVLEPLYGYLLLAEKMHTGQPVADSYNFGPPHNATTTVLKVAEIARNEWPSSLEFTYPNTKAKLRESDTLKLNSSNSFKDLGWKGILSVEEAIKFTLDWEKAVLDHSPLDVTRSQINNYLERQS